MLVRRFVGLQITIIFCEGQPFEHIIPFRFSRFFLTLVHLYSPLTDDVALFLLPKSTELGHFALNCFPE